MLGTDVPRIGMSRERIDVLVFNRQHQPVIVLGKSCVSTCMCDPLKQITHIPLTFRKVSHISLTGLTAIPHIAMLVLRHRNTIGKIGFNVIVTNLRLSADSTCSAPFSYFGSVQAQSYIRPDPSRGQCESSLQPIL